MRDARERPVVVPIVVVAVHVDVALAIPAIERRVAIVRNAAYVVTAH